jgi:hypothetical protein
VRPGAVAQPDQGLIDRIRRLEQIVEEQQRRDMNRATVGQGGTFRGYYDNGQLAFTFGEDIDDGVRKIRMNYPSTGTQALQVGPGNPNANEAEQFRLRDQSNRNMFATDGLAGYGLAEPSFQFLLCTVYGLAWVNAVEQAAARANAFLYNAALVSTIQTRNFAGGVTAVAGKLRVTNGSGSTITSSTVSSIGSNGIATRCVLLTPDFLNDQGTKVEWLLTTTGGGTMDVWPRECRGVSKSFYDFNPQFQ